jgi:hypothetical protein
MLRRNEDVPAIAVEISHISADISALSRWEGTLIRTYNGKNALE